MSYFRLLTALMLAGNLAAAHAAPVQEAALGIMCYHNVVDESRPQPKLAEHEEMAGELERQYFPQTISVNKLVEHFNWLKNNGYTPVSWQQVEDARAGKTPLPAKPVLLTFDDGYVSFYEQIYPLLKAYRFPAVMAFVTSWLEVPAGGTIQYGNQKLPRNEFVSWAQIREMQNSGLIEVASHTDNLHHSITGNSFGSQFAAALPGQYKNGRYETRAEYHNRIRQDLQRSSDLIARHTGRRPRVLVWPYGQFNQAAIEIARQVGFESDLTLSDRKLNSPSSPHMGRLLLDQETNYSTIKAYLNEQIFVPPTQRIMQVDLDYIYDKNPQQESRNIDLLINRISKLQPTTVYLQAFADEDGNGTAEAAYFPNRHLKMKSDLFSRVAWQLMTRTHAQVYAWMPMMAMDLGSGYEYVKDHKLGRPNQAHYLRLSPYSEKSRRAAMEVYEDLAFYSRFNGILFHDDGFLTDQEQPERSAADKTDDLMRYSDQLKAAALTYSFNGQDMMKTARNLYASVVMDEKAQQWFAQSLPKFTAHYDYTALMAMPYMENEQAIDAQAAQKWLNRLVTKVKQSGVPTNKVIFELQARNWRTERPIDDGELIGWMKSLKQNGINNYGYYPDDFLNDQPDAKRLKASFSNAY